MRTSLMISDIYLAKMPALTKMSPVYTHKPFCKALPRRDNEPIWYTCIIQCTYDTMLDRSVELSLLRVAVSPYVNLMFCWKVQFHTSYKYTSEKIFTSGDT